MKFDEVLFTLYTVILEVKKFTPCFTALIRASVSLDLQNNCFIFQEDLLLSRFTMNLTTGALFFNVSWKFLFKKSYFTITMRI